MTDSTPTPLDALTPEDREALTVALKGLQEMDPQPPILIPHDIDLDGDGLVDAWGLDADGNLTFVSGKDIAETSFESLGEHDAAETTEGGE